METTTTRTATGAKDETKTSAWDDSIPEPDDSAPRNTVEPFYCERHGEEITCAFDKCDLCDAEADAPNHISDIDDEELPEEHYYCVYCDAAMISLGRFGLCDRCEKEDSETSEETEETDNE
jgi:hypothetical protein